MGARAKPLPDATPLGARLKQRIVRDGPISVHDYMESCLADRSEGYYPTRQPIGRDGDFITAPEISQIFGELIGAWAGAVWQEMGAPSRVTVAELGPGRGSLMQDALRVFRTVPKLAGSLDLALIETSPVLREVQGETLRDSPAPLNWLERIEDVPQGPLILIANEFIDALPIRQMLRVNGTWHERAVTIGADGGFAFCTGEPMPSDAVPASMHSMDPNEGAIAELRPAAATLLASLAARAKHAPLAALIADYGHDAGGIGDTLQAVARHQFADPLAAPGQADLTAHVDFATLRQTARDLGLSTFGPMPQGEFLLKLGLEARLERLIRNATEDQKAALLSGAARLVDSRQMGALFKVLVLQSSGLAPPPPFGDSWSAKPPPPPW
jgi:NADH dehydrogenase [ubiquinone] 1 alpha subcomplex assembly factor 7